MCLVCYCCCLSVVAARFPSFFLAGKYKSRMAIFHPIIRGTQIFWCSLQLRRHYFSEKAKKYNKQKNDNDKNDDIF